MHWGYNSNRSVNIVFNEREIAKRVDDLLDSSNMARATHVFYIDQIKSTDCVLKTTSQKSYFQNQLKWQRPNSFCNNAIRSVVKAAYQKKYFCGWSRNRRILRSNASSTILWWPPPKDTQLWLTSYFVFGGVNEFDQCLCAVVLSAKEFLIMTLFPGCFLDQCKRMVSSFLLDGYNYYFLNNCYPYSYPATCYWNNTCFTLFYSTF